MKTTKLLAAAAALAVAVAIPIFAQSDDADHQAKLDDIRKLLDMNGGAATAKDTIAQMSGSMARAMPQVPKEFWEEFTKELDPKELVELSVPSYDKYLTHDDVKELVKFYETPAGKKLASAQPKIALESMQAGQQWGMALGQKVARKLQERQAREREEQRRKQQEKEKQQQQAETPKGEGK
jgi:hypothetical protein